MKNNLIFASLLLITASGHKTFCEATSAPGSRPNGLSYALFAAKNRTGSSHFYCAAQGVDTTLIIDSGSRAIQTIYALSGSDIDEPSKDTRKSTPLMIASASRKPDTIKTLINLNADVNQTDRLGSTALHYATERSNIASQPIDNEAAAQSIQYLLGYGANVDARGAGGSTALTTATNFGSIRQMIVLLMYRANPDSALSSGATALMAAVRNSNPEATELLLNHGANVLARMNNGETVLDIARKKEHNPACEKKDKKILALLLAAEKSKKRSSIV